MHEDTKTIETRGKRWQIRRMMPDVGSYITSRIIAARMDAGIGMENPDKTVVTQMFAAFLRGLDFETFRFIQRSALAVVAQLEPDGTLMPVMSDTGVFADKSIQNSLPLVLDLTVQSLVFNLSDFFSEGGLSAIMPTRPDSSQ